MCKSNFGRPRRDVLSVAASARWRGDSKPSTRRCPRDRVENLTHWSISAQKAAVGSLKKQMVAGVLDQFARDRVRTVAPFYQLHAVHDPLDDVRLEPFQEQVFGKIRVSSQSDDSTHELGICLGETYGYPSADPGADLCANQPVIRRSATGGDAPRHLIYALSRTSTTRLWSLGEATVSINCFVSASHFERQASSMFPFERPTPW